MESIIMMKWFGLIDLSWWEVLSGYLIIIGMIVLCIIGAIIKDLWDRFQKWREDKYENY